MFQHNTSHTSTPEMKEEQGRLLFGVNDFFLIYFPFSVPYYRPLSRLISFIRLKDFLPSSDPCCMPLLRNWSCHLCVHASTTFVLLVPFV